MPLVLKQRAIAGVGKAQGTPDKASGTNSSRGTALVVGGGPAGALAAKVLADRGFQVTVCEAYPHPSGSSETCHSYVISLNPRGTRALHAVGVDAFKELEGGQTNTGVIRHGTKPDSKPKVTTKDEPSVVIKRQQLTVSLLELAARAGAQIRYNEKLTKLDFKARSAFFERKEENGKKILSKLSFDLLVGADGVHSTVRRCLEEDGLIKDTRTEADDMEYQVGILDRHWKDIIRSPKDSQGVGVLCAIPEIATHTWADRKNNTNALLYPLPEKKSMVIIISPSGQLDAMKQGDTYGPALETLFPNWNAEAREELIPRLKAADNVPKTGGLCIWTSAVGLESSAVVLLGDAGHAMWPSLGQGCNAALESVAVFDQAIGSSLTYFQRHGVTVPGADLARLIAAEYQGRRHEDVKAAVELTFGGMGGRRTRGMQNAQYLFLAQFMLMLLLHKLTCKVVPMPALLQVFQGDEASYSALLRQNRYEKILTLVILGVCILLGLVAIFRRLL